MTQDDIIRMAREAGFVAASFCRWSAYTDDLARFATLVAALAQQAEPVEPVAEARYDGTLRWLEPHGVGLHRIQGPLYTAPPQRKPLTDEEIDALPWNGSPRQFARAVERAHGIGEEK